VAITDAVVPVGGLGTRLLPATRSQPKEMLPVVDKPVVQYVVEELVRAGIARVLFVTGRRKRAIEDHFDADPELDTGPLIDPRTGLQILYTRQARPAGLGDAVRHAEGFAHGEGVVLAVGDAIIQTPASAARGIVPRLIEAYERGGASAVVAIQEVPAEHVSRYGIATAHGRVGATGAVEITDIVEKPARAARHVSIRWRTSIPRSVGLGGSSAIVLATLKALCALHWCSPSPDQLAGLALAVEVEDLGIAAGLQDRVAQAYEGLTFMDFGAAGSTAGHGQYESLAGDLLPPLVLAWRTETGENSGAVHGDLRARFARGDAIMRAAMSELAAAARSARDALLAGDHEALAAGVDASFDARARMLRLDPRHIEMIRTARACGASANHAGSGGSIVCVPGRGSSVRADRLPAGGRLRRDRPVGQPAAGQPRGVRSMSELSNTTSSSLRMTRLGPASTAPATCAVNPSPVATRTTSCPAPAAQ